MSQLRECYNPCLIKQNLSEEVKQTHSHTRRNKRSTPCKNYLHLLFFFFLRYMTNVFFIIVYYPMRRSVHPSSEGFLTSSKLLNRLLTLCLILSYRLLRGKKNPDLVQGLHGFCGINPALPDLHSVKQCYG